MRGYELFGLSLADRWALVLHDPCRGCVSNAHPPLRISNLKVCISPDWRCQLDPWMHVPPKNLRLESQCAPQQTPDGFAIQALHGNRTNGNCDADDGADGFQPRSADQSEALINL